MTFTPGANAGGLVHHAAFKLAGQELRSRRVLGRQVGFEGLGEGIQELEGFEIGGPQ